MSYVWIAGNGVAVISSIVCMSYLYRYRWSDRRSRWPLLSVMLIGLIALATGLQFVYPEVLAALRRNPDALAAGEWWRFVTPLFVQPQGWIQLASNAFLLLAFVPLAERIYGGRLVTLFFFAGIVGQIVNYWWNPYGGGSSPAAFGIMGSLLTYVIIRHVEMARSVVALAIAGLAAAAVLSFFRDGHGPSLLAGALLSAGMRARELPALKTGTVRSR